VIWVLFTVVAVLLVGVFGAMIAGWVRYDPMPEPVTTQPDTGLPEHFRAPDITAVHFDTALRGYRMDQVDAVLDRLQERLADQERELAALRGGQETPEDRVVADTAPDARPSDLPEPRSSRAGSRSDLLEPRSSAPQPPSAPGPAGWPAPAAGRQDPQGSL
jgi:DivIVA domain-containing protein